MTEYKPDSWVVVKITSEDHGTYYKILAGWSGGYTYGDSWKLNSGIVKVDVEEDGYAVYGVSESVYMCHKLGEGLRMSIAGIYNQLKDRFGDEIEIVDMVDVEEQYFLDANE